MKYSTAGKSAAEFKSIMESWLKEKGVEYKIDDLSYWCGYICSMKNRTHSSTKGYWLNRFEGWVKSQKHSTGEQTCRK